MKFSAWLENKLNRPLPGKGFDPRLARQTRRSERRWNDTKEKRRKLEENQDHSRRDELLTTLQQNFPGAFLKTSEEFEPNRLGGIWITGKNMADYYGKDNTGFDYWVNPKLQRTLEKYGFYLEPYDPETWFAWPVTKFPSDMA